MREEKEAGNDLPDGNSAEAENPIQAGENVEPGHREIEEISRETGIVEASQVRHTLKNQYLNLHSKIGEILCNIGSVNQEQISSALEAQAGNPSRRLGQILLDAGVINEEMLALAIALKYGLPYVDLSEYPVDPAALDQVSSSLARKLSVLPLHLDDKGLIVAISDPSNPEPKQDLTFHTGKVIKEAVATSRGIITAINRFYGSDSQSTLEKLLNEHSYVEQISTVREDQFELGGETGHEKPIIELVNHLIKSAVEKNASDLHIIPKGKRVKVVLRIDGELYEDLTLRGDRLQSVITRLKIMGNMNIAEHRLPQDGRAKVKVNQKIVDLRFSCIPSILGEAIVVRILDKERGVMSLDDLGFMAKELEEIRASLKKPYGMILVTGATGSGKSSTIYALLQEPIFSNKNVITLEDPVEYQLPGPVQIQIKEKIGLTFAQGLRQILRHDPDVIVVGEIRDSETARIAIQSALTGHVLFSTLHTNTAAESFIRLGEMGVEPYLVSSSILGIIAQRLIRKLCPHCKAPDTEALEKLAGSRFPVTPPDDAEFYKSTGCEKCHKTGFQGRTVAYEYLAPNEEIKNAATNSRSASEIRELAISRGMRTIEQVCMEKAARGVTTIDEILPLATNYNGS